METRMVSKALSSEIPMAVKTWEAEVFPEEHADPELIAMPSISKAMSWVMLGAPGIWIERVLATRGAPDAQMEASGQWLRIFCSRSRRKVSTVDQS